MSHGRSAQEQRRQYVTFRSEEFQRGQLKLGEPNGKGALRKGNAEESNKQVLWFYGFLEERIQQTRLAQRDRGPHRSRAAALPRRPCSEEPTAQHRDTGTTTISTRSDTKRKTLNLSGL